MRQIATVPSVFWSFGTSGLSEHPCYVYVPGSSREGEELFQMIKDERHQQQRQKEPRALTPWIQISELLFMLESNPCIFKY